MAPIEILTAESEVATRKADIIAVQSQIKNYEDQLKKGDNIILTAFGGGFTWGAVYLKWAYNPS